jgi:hypothetical protein
MDHRSQAACLLAQEYTIDAGPFYPSLPHSYVGYNKRWSEHWMNRKLDEMDQQKTLERVTGTFPVALDLLPDHWQTSYSWGNARERNIENNGKEFINQCFLNCTSSSSHLHLCHTSIFDASTAS